MDLNHAAPTVIPITFKGEFVGCAVHHGLGVQFVARDRRVEAMDRSIWPSAAYAEAAARQLAASVRA